MPSNRLCGVLAAVTALVTALVLPATSGADVVTDPPRTAGIERVAVDDAYTAAVEASRSAFPAGQRPHVVYLVNAQRTAQVLAAAPAALHHGGTTLLTTRAGLPDVVAQELRRLAPARVVIVGDTSAVDAEVERAVRRLAPVERVAGTDDTDTVHRLVRQAFGELGAPELWIAAQDGPEAAVAAAASSAAGAPLLLVRGSRGALDPATTGLLTDLGVERVVLVGPPARVSRAVETDLDRRAGVHVTRLAGADAAATSAVVAARIHPGRGAEAVFLAAVDDPASQVIGSVRAAVGGGPLLLSARHCAPEPVADRLSSPGIDTVTVVGDRDVLRGVVGSGESCRSRSEPESPWVVVNKTRPFQPMTYAPTDLVSVQGHQVRADIAADLRSMLAASAEEGAGRLAVVSGFRSRASQQTVWESRAASRGTGYADRWIARAGHSEHQSGLAVDVAPVGVPGCSTHTCIGGTPQGEWLAENAWRFGFIVRYESGQEHVTGYSAEPWHLRYVGRALAADYHRDGWRSLEAYFGLPPAPDYPGQDRPSGD